MGRITFPYDLEWMTGSILDHVERVRAGQPIYVEPSDGFIPFLYPPLYYWVCALLGGSTVACRLVSVASTFAELGLAVVIARSLGASKVWSYVAAGLVLACFPYVGWWYDLERSDVLASALALGGAAAIVRAKSAKGFALAGALFAFGCLAKQQALFVGAGAGAGLIVATRFGKERARLRDVVVFGGTFAVVLVALLALAIHRESRWLVYYVLQMPRAHGVLASLVVPTLSRDLGEGFLLAVVTIGAPLAMIRRLPDFTSKQIAFAGMLVMGFAGAVSSRLHIGGWINVLQPWSSLAAIAVALVGARLEDLAKGWAAPAVIVAQLAVWSYDPGRACPPRASWAGHQASRDLVHALEKEGEVLAPATGHVTTPRHFHVSSLADVARVEGHSPRALVDKLGSRAYVAIVDGARVATDPAPDPDWPPVLLEDFADLREPMLRNYFVSEKLDDSAGALALASPNRPIWVYRRRHETLAPGIDLRKRQLAEMSLAADREKTLKAGGKPSYEPADIETLAAR